MVDDGGRLSKSSRMASGLINPVTGLRWTADDRAFEDVMQIGFVYKRISEVLGYEVMKPVSIIRAFTGPEDKQYFDQRADEDSVKTFLTSPTSTELEALPLDAPFGAGFIHMGGVISSEKFLSDMRAWIKSKAALVEARLNWDELQWCEDDVVWNGHAANFVIAAEGNGIMRNPDLPEGKMQPVKGEVLTVRIPDLPDDRVYIRGIHIVPMGHQLFKVGATYDREQVDQIPTDQGRAWLESRLQQFITCPYEVIDHRAGIRPATVTREPFLEAFGENEAGLMVNGLGSRALYLMPSLLPKISAHFDKFIL